MSTTTVRLEERLKARLAAAAARTGTTPHAFILDAIEETVERAEIEAAFHQVAEARWAKFLQSGKVVSWEDGRAYVEAISRGERPRKPAARRLEI